MPANSWAMRCGGSTKSTTPAAMALRGMLRVEVLHQDECHSGGCRQTSEEFAERFQAAGRGTHTDYDQVGVVDQVSIGHRVIVMCFAVLGFGRHGGNSFLHSQTAFRLS